jgi:shikimate 5-dehydrogenase
MSDDSVRDSGSSIDNRHLLLAGAGPGLGIAVARRFASGGYRVTLVARSTDGLGKLADALADTAAQIDTIAADASDPEALGARMAQLYNSMVRPGSSSTTRPSEPRTTFSAPTSSSCRPPTRSTSSARSS